ncbi:MAG: hypothetical protein II649_09215, partial [Kiritimatiellae bacterium]|nr:hypothetical protein [Kiritimatiellia bacterium]
WVLCRYEYGGMGRDVRTWCNENPDGGVLAIVDSVEDIPDNCGHLILVGRACRDYLRVLMKQAGNISKGKVPRPKCLTLISPNLSVAKLPEKMVESLGIRSFEGEFLAEVSGDAQKDVSWLEIVPECELYLPNWLNLALGNDKK